MTRKTCNLIFVVFTLLCSIVALPHVLVAMPEPATLELLAKTKPGSCAADFINMMNDATPDSIRKFENAWASKSRLGKMSMDDRVKRLTDMRSQWQGCTLVEIGDASDAGTSTTLKLGTGASAEVEFQFSKSEPGKLEVMMIEIDDSGGPAIKLTPELRAKAIEDTAKALRDGYVYPEVGEKMALSVLGKLKAGEYDKLEDTRKFARRITDDLRAISKDKHLGLRPAPREIAKPAENRHDDGRIEMRRANYAFKKVEVLPGNVGYIRFDMFVEDPEANKVATAAIGFVANCDALIIDLRNNGGGSPEMIRFLSSYLFDEPTHLNDMIDRDGKVVEEYWTLKDIPGQRLAKDLPVYVLCSSTTFSGAEEFCYNLKNLKRATIVGEVTGGGAHPVRTDRISDHFVIRVPFMRANNPISKTNWEGTGVQPDVVCAAGEAQDKAFELAKAAIETRR